MHATTRVKSCSTKFSSPCPSWTSLVLQGHKTHQSKEQKRPSGQRPHVSPVTHARSTVQPSHHHNEFEEPSTSGREAAQARTTPEFRSSVLRDVVTGFRTQPYEFDYWVEEGMVSGKIPEELRGTYFRNGPGLQIGNQRYQRHHLDGDGCVLSLAFPGGGRMPRFINKYVRTKGFLAEQAAGKPLYRNAFTRGSADGSPLFNPLDLSFKNVANTGVLYWAGRLWALWEVGRPYELDPHTLETRGEDTIDGQIGQRLAGHYRVVTEPDGSRRCICFGTLVTISGTEIEFFEFDEAGHLMVRSRQSLQGFDIMPIHDMLVTEHWYIVLLGPVKFDLWRLFSDYATSKCSLAELMEFDPQLPSKVMLFPRPGKFYPGVTATSTRSSASGGRAEVVYGHGKVKTTDVAIVEGQVAGQEPGAHSEPQHASGSHNKGSSNINGQEPGAHSKAPQHASSSHQPAKGSNSINGGHGLANEASKGGTKGYVSFYREGSINSDVLSGSSGSGSATGSSSMHSNELAYSSAYDSSSSAHSGSSMQGSAPGMNCSSCVQHSSMYGEGSANSSSSTNGSSHAHSSTNGGEGSSNGSTNGIEGSANGSSSTAHSSTYGGEGIINNISVNGGEGNANGSSSANSSSSSSSSGNGSSRANGSEGSSNGSSSGSEQTHQFRATHELPPPVVVEGPSFFSFHHVNAYEVHGGAQVVLDTIGWQDLKVDVTQHNVKEDYFHGGCRSHLHRLTIDVPSARTHVCMRLLRRTLEFPTLNSAVTGKPYHHAYFASDAVDHEVAWAPAQALLKVTLPLASAGQEPQDADAHPGNSSSRSTPSTITSSSHGDSKAAGISSSSSTPSTVTSSSHGKSIAAGISSSSSTPSTVTSSSHGDSKAAGTSVWWKSDNRCNTGPEGPTGLAPGVRMAEWRPGERCFMQEPLFVPRQDCSAEDDGWIIVAVHNAATLKGEIAILDAQRIQDGPVALIRLPHALPYGLHGTWTREYLGPDPDDPTVPHWCTPNRIREL